MKNQETSLTTPNVLTMRLIDSLAKRDDMALTMMESELTIAQSMNEGTSLNKLAKTQDRPALIKCLSFIVMRAMDSFNVGSKINDSQSVTLAFDLLEVFGYENLEDVILMFKYARQGKIGGKIFRIDSHVITTEWLPEYLELKAIERENQWGKSKSEMNNIVQRPEDVDSVKGAQAGMKIWEAGKEQGANNRKNYAPGLGSNLKKWLGQSPITEAWGDIKNPVNVEKHKENLTKSN